MANEGSDDAAETIDFNRASTNGATAMGAIFAFMFLAMRREWGRRVDIGVVWRGRSEPAD